MELLEYDYEIIHHNGALHHVLDVLSRMYESKSEGLVTVAMDTDKSTETQDRWYLKRFKEITSEPRKFPYWKIADGNLYFCLPKPVVSEIVEDLDQWKLVFPKKLRSQALRELHDSPQAGHLGIEKTYH